MSPDATPSRRRLWFGLILGFSAMVGIGLFGLWRWFHTIPTEAMVRDALRTASRLELVEFEDGKWLRTAKLEDPKLWADLPDRVKFGQLYWLFSDEPTKSLVLKVFDKDGLNTVLDVREDGCLHVRKAARWYRMPLAAGFKERVEELFAAHVAADGTGKGTGNQP